MSEENLNGHSHNKTSKEIIDEFFYTFHPEEVEEYLRELMTVVSNPQTSVTSREEEDLKYFFGRLAELVKAIYLLRSQH